MTDYEWHNVSPEDWRRLKACETVLLALSPELLVYISAEATSHKLRLSQDRDYVDLAIDVDTYSALADLLVRLRPAQHPELAP